MIEATFTVTFCPDTEDIDEARQEALDFQACIREGGGYFHGLQFGLIEVVDIPDEDDKEEWGKDSATELLERGPR